jgi:8-oxo-dGTP pyrophosphatase MutT (NUDIX family)
MDIEARSQEKIRPIAICVCLHEGSILVAEYCEKGRLYYRPLGGAIEFGERGFETVRREFREEIGADLVEIKYLGLLENIYSVEGEQSHQIVLVYDARLSDGTFYDEPIITGDELGQPFQAVWKRLEIFSPGNPPVYPDGLLALLEK